MPPMIRPTSWQRLINMIFWYVLNKSGGEGERGGRNLDGSGGIEYSPAARRKMNDASRIAPD